MDDPAPPPLALNPLRLQVQTSPPPVDRGVYTSATQTIPAGTLVEQSPVLVFSKDEWLDKAQHTLLQHYTFVWGKKGDMALALGMGESARSTLVELSCRGAHLGQTERARTSSDLGLRA
jgi:hypothetical protein